MKDWKIGDKVVFLGKGGFVNSLGLHGEFMLIDNFPITDQIYTIRDIGCRGDIVFIKLVEIINPVLLMDTGDIGETSWDARDFRRLREISIECFRKHLTKVHKSVKEDA